MSVCSASTRPRTRLASSQRDSHDDDARVADAADQLQRPVVRSSPTFTTISSTSGSADRIDSARG